MLNEEEREALNNLISACKAGNVEIVRSLLTVFPAIILQRNDPSFFPDDANDYYDHNYMGARTNNEQELRQMPLTICLLNNDIRLLRLLVEDFNACLQVSIPLDNSFPEPLSICVDLRSFEAMKILLPYCNLYSVRNAFQQSLLNCSLDIADFLLQHNMNMIDVIYVVNFLATSHLSSYVSSDEFKCIISWLHARGFLYCQKIICCLILECIDADAKDALSLLIGLTGVPDILRENFSNMTYPDEVQEAAPIHQSIGNHSHYLTYLRSVDLGQNIIHPRILPVLKHPFPNLEAALFLEGQYFPLYNRGAPNLEVVMSFFFEEFIRPDPRILIYSFPYGKINGLQDISNFRSILDIIINAEYFDLLDRCMPYLYELVSRSELTDSSTITQPECTGFLLNPHKVLHRIEESLVLRLVHTIQLKELADVSAIMAEIQEKLQFLSSDCTMQILLDSGYQNDFSAGGLWKNFNSIRKSEVEEYLIRLAIKESIVRDRPDMYRIVMTKNGTCSADPYAMTFQSSDDYKITFMQKYRWAMKSSSVSMLNYLVDQEIVAGPLPMMRGFELPMKSSFTEAYKVNNAKILQYLLQSPAVAKYAKLNESSLSEILRNCCWESGILSPAFDVFAEFLPSFFNKGKMCASELKNENEDILGSSVLIIGGEITVETARILHRHNLLFVIMVCERGKFYFRRCLTNRTSGINLEVLDMLFVEIAGDYLNPTNYAKSLRAFEYMENWFAANRICIGYRQNIINRYIQEKKDLVLSARNTL